MRRSLFKEDESVYLYFWGGRAPFSGRKDMKDFFRVKRLLSSKFDAKQMVR